MMGLTARRTYLSHLVPGLNILAVLIFGLVGLAGCGYKTMPVPPEEIVPQPITDLRYELNEKGVDLYWTFPSGTVTGDRLDEITSFSLYRAVVPADDYCDTCPIPFGEPIVLGGGAVAEDTAKVKNYSTTLLRPGHLYFFKVRSKSGWWAESADSNIVSFMWNTPPMAPEKITAEAGDSMIELTWSPVEKYIDGTTIQEPVKYLIFRSLGSGPYTPLGGLRDEVHFVDRNVVNGRKYSYRVKAYTMYTKGQVGGGSSPSVSAVPVDRAAPAVPTEVRAIRTANQVKVVWKAVPDADLKGYRIYRRTADSDSPVQVGEVNAPYTLFTDESAPDTAVLFYSVSSFDDGTPPNESEPSAEVSPR